MNTQQYQELLAMDARILNIHTEVTRCMVDTYNLSIVPFKDILLLPLGKRVEALPGVYANASIKTSSYVKIDCDATPGATLLLQRHPDSTELFEVTGGSMTCLVTGVELEEGDSQQVPMNGLHGYKVGAYGVTFTSTIRKATAW